MFSFFFNYINLSYNVWEGKTQKVLRTQRYKNVGTFYLKNDLQTMFLKQLSIPFLD